MLRKERAHARSKERAVIRIAAVALSVLLLGPSPAGAQVKKWVDEKGVVHIEAEGPHVDRSQPYEPPPKITEEPPSAVRPQGPSPPGVMKTRPRSVFRKPPARKPPRLQLAFGKQTDFIEGSYHHIQGVIKNRSGVAARWVKVKAKLFDMRGRLLRIEEAYADPYHIPPRGESTFHFMFPASADFKRYKLSATSRR